MNRQLTAASAVMMMVMMMFLLSVPTIVSASTPITGGGSITLTTGDYHIPAGTSVGRTGTITINGNVNINLEAESILSVTNFFGAGISVNSGSILTITGSGQLSLLTGSAAGINNMGTLNFNGSVVANFESGITGTGNWNLNGGYVFAHSVSNNPTFNGGTLIIQPANQTVTYPAPATFTLDVRGANIDNNIVWQWSTNNFATHTVAGTGATHNTGATNLSMSNRRYRAVITIGTIVNSSNMVVLTVNRRSISTATINLTSSHTSPPSPAPIIATSYFSLKITPFFG